jgi:hypothetical protein
LLQPRFRRATRGTGNVFQEKGNREAAKYFRHKQKKGRHAPAFAALVVCYQPPEVESLPQVELVLPLVPGVLFSLPVAVEPELPAVPLAGAVLVAAAPPIEDGVFSEDVAEEEPKAEPLSVPVVVEGEAVVPVEGDVAEELPLSVGVAAEDEAEPDVAAPPEPDSEDGVVEKELLEEPENDDGVDD